MIYSIYEIQQRIAPVAKQYGVKAVFLFGSYARGEAREDSDIDLLVDTSGTNLRSLLSLGALYLPRFHPRGQLSHHGEKCAFPCYSL